MKKISMIGAALLAVAAFISCSKSVVAPVTEETIYTKSTLALEVNGHKIDNGYVVYTPNNGGDAEKAGIKVSREGFDIAGLMPGITGAGVIPSHILPGVNDLLIGLNLNIDGDMATFAGESSATYFTYKYSGSVSKQKLTLQLQSNVGESFMAGLWNLNKPEAVFGSTIYSNFQPAATNALAQMLNTILPLIPISVNDQKTNLEGALASVFDGFSFYGNGDVSVMYKTPAASSFITSASNLVSFIPVGDGKDGKGSIQAFPNFTEIWNAVMTKADEIDVTQILAVVVPFINNACSYGLPIYYSTENSVTTLILDTIVTKELLNLAYEVCQVPGVTEKICELLKNEGLPEMFVNMIPKLIQMLNGDGDMMKNLTTAEIGIKLVRSLA